MDVAASINALDAEIAGLKTTLAENQAKLKALEEEREAQLASTPDWSEITVDTLTVELTPGSKDSLGIYPRRPC